MFGWEFPPHNSGGLGVACFGLTRALSELGDQITFVMPKKLEVGAPWVEMVFATLPAMEMIAVRSPISGYGWNGSYLSNSFKMNSVLYGYDLLSEVLRYAATGRDIALSHTFDIIYAHDWLSFGAGIEAKRVTGKPLIVHVHATEFDRCGGSSGVNQDVFQIEKLGMQEADVVIAVSQFTKDIITKEYDIPPAKVRVVHNGIDDATMPKGNGDLPRLRSLKRAGYKIVLFLGRITLQKGPDYFIRVAKRVTQHNPKIIFVMSGSGDMERQSMELSARLGISDKVLFTGFVSGAERHEMYATADLFVMPSVSEPFGITPLEAMKLGVPTLVSKQSGVSEAIRHTLKVDFWDIDEMSNKILSLIGYPGLAKTLSENGVREADHITWMQAAQKVDTIIQELVGVR